MKVKRESYLAKLRQLRGTRLIKVLTGMRRVGKSVLLSSFRDELLASGTPAKCIQFLNFEDRKNLHLTDWMALHDEIEARLVPRAMNTIFLDEIQMVDGFECLLDALFIKENIDLYVTGSNAFLLSGELATLLSGRHISVNVLPFSFAEFCLAHPDRSADTLLRAYVNSSALPEAVNLAAAAPEQVNQYLRDVFDTVVQKDIKKRSPIRGMANFESVAKFSLDSVGSFVSSTSIANVLNAGKHKNERRVSHHTIEKHLERLVGAFILYKADRYDIHGKKLLKTQQKYYAVDLGLKSVVAGAEAGMSLGRKLENLVYLELRRRNIGDIWVGKQDNAEVDFVVQNNAGERAYYQVAWSAAENETLARELRSLQKISDNYPKFLITADPDTATFNGIQKINVIDWLLANDAVM